MPQHGSVRSGHGCGLYFQAEVFFLDFFSFFFLKKTELSLGALVSSSSFSGWSGCSQQINLK